MFIAGAAIGYVLGARDGRGRYEQIKSQADSLWHDPRVQEKVSTASATVKEKAPEVQAKLTDAASHAADAAKTKLGKDKSDENLGAGTTTYPPTQPSSD
ncbi:MAG: YtxH domain-containing protein [Micrococcales bacterium]|nr:YtxH domain-containing protein [Micrococcales bacterium]